MFSLFYFLQQKYIDDHLIKKKKSYFLADKSFVMSIMGKVDISKKVNINILN